MKKTDRTVQRFSRRSFFRYAGAGTATIAGLSLLTTSCSSVSIRKKISSYFSVGDVVLFQGDSITDAGREKQREMPNSASSFGTGYAAITASWLLAEFPEMELTIYNRGISGNKVYQLEERWEKDCLDLEPDVLSILIGVNDYWHMRGGGYDGTPEIYENDFRALLNRTRSAFPGIKLVICQPFVLTGTSAVDDTWLEPFSAYQQIAAALSEEYDAVWVPFQERFDEAVELAPATYWTGDGVHPSMAGAQLMATSWLEAVAAG